ncbi:phosphatase PAP2 family protein [Paenibacillus tyrfis]|uniref:phosphatase PAP2 family protein n=1 Tax=Paenibacillus tyrfis TaxID=1501230 RepID=UPI0020A2188C|nr:phosphatase PAP2 family protein [Paenibacillus tyrfis]MCP1311373.1 phosphatase PAP2 family protein [Paenibacillus tyrfis]
MNRSYVIYAYVLSLLAACGFGIIALAVKGDRLLAFDHSISSLIQSWESAGWTRFMKGFSWIGSTMPIIVLSLGMIIVLYVLLGRRKELLLFIAAIGGSTAVGYVSKSLFARERPNFHRLLEEDGFSFPSSSSVAAVALYGIIVYLLWSHIRNRTGKIALTSAAIFMMVCIGLSRIYLGVHYPSDVIGGMLAGAAWLWLAIAVYKHLSDSHDRSAKLSM